MGLRLLGALILDIIWKSPASASPPFSAGSFPSRRCVMQNGYGLLLTETIGLPMKIGQPPQTQISSFQPWIVKIPIYNLYMYIYIYQFHQYFRERILSRIGFQGQNQVCSWVARLHSQIPWYVLGVFHLSPLQKKSPFPAVNCK